MSRDINRSLLITASHHDYIIMYDSIDLVNVLILVLQDRQSVYVSFRSWNLVLFFAVDRFPFSWSDLRLVSWIFQSFDRCLWQTALWSLHHTMRVLSCTIRELINAMIRCFTHRQSVCVSFRSWMLICFAMDLSASWFDLFWFWSWQYRMNLDLCSSIAWNIDQCCVVRFVFNLLTAYLIWSVVWCILVHQQRSTWSCYPVAVVSLIFDLCV